MDPVNKWLWTIILFMTTLIIVIGFKAGSGRYEMQVVHFKALKNHDLVYILDTKDGTIKARALDHEKFRIKTGSKAGEISKKWKPIKSENIGQRQWNPRTSRYDYGDER